MYVIALLDYLGDTIGYRADTDTWCITQDAECGKMFDDSIDATLSILAEIWPADFNGLFQIEEL